MGQQLSSEGYCVATMQRLAAELNTTDSQVSECRVLSSSWSGSDSLKLQFSWQEWHRVSGYLERVLPAGEQRRLLDHLLLDVTGLRSVDLGAIWESVIGIGAEDADTDSDEVFASSASSVDTQDAAETPSMSLNAAGHWTVHPDWEDQGSSSGNPLLYRDFAKLHLQLEPVFSAFNLDLSELMTTPSDVESNGYQHQQEVTSASVSVYGYRPRRRLIGVGTAQLREFVATFADRVTELVRSHCAKLGVGFLITRARYHPGHNCIVISGTADVRSLLRQSGGLELRSWANDEAEGQELTDQLQRSIGRGFDGLMESRKQHQTQQQQTELAQQQQRHKFFPMVMYYCDARKMVTIIYGLETKELTL